VNEKTPDAVAGGRTDRAVLPNLPRADHLLDLLGQRLVPLLLARVLALLAAPAVLFLQAQPVGLFLDGAVPVRRGGNDQAGLALAEKNLSSVVDTIHRRAMLHA
jgi:hypothetical protein